eukprot:2677573-Rhodomonas_salina.2
MMIRVRAPVACLRSKLTVNIGREPTSGRSKEMAVVTARVRGQDRDRDRDQPLAPSLGTSLGINSTVTSTRNGIDGVTQEEDDDGGGGGPGIGAEEDDGVEGDGRFSPRREGEDRPLRASDLGGSVSGSKRPPRSGGAQAEPTEESEEEVDAVLVQGLPPPKSNARHGNLGAVSPKREGENTYECA